MQDLSNYLLVFYSIVVGFVATEFLAGWRELIRNRNRYTFYSLHIGWTILAFILLIQNWWGSWQDRLSIGLNFGYFLLKLSTPVCFYLLTVLLFPANSADGRDKINFRQQFQSSSKSLHLSAFGLVCLFIVTGIVLAGEPLLAWAVWIRGLAAVPILLAAFYNRSWFHVAVFVYSFALFIIFVFTVRWNLI